MILPNWNIFIPSQGAELWFNNLTLACTVCNQKKRQSINRGVLSDDLSRLKRVKSHQKYLRCSGFKCNLSVRSAPLTNLNVVMGHGQKWSGFKQNYDKQHWMSLLIVATYRNLENKSTSRGQSQRTWKPSECANEQVAFRVLSLNSHLKIGKQGISLSFDW